MAKLLFPFLLIVISANYSYAQLSVNSKTLRILKLTFTTNETEPIGTEYINEEIQIRITPDILIIDDEIFKVVYTIKKRYSNVYKIYFRDENEDPTSDYPELIQFVEYFPIEKILKKVDIIGNEYIVLNYLLE
jgi:hypothetical protein